MRRRPAAKAMGGMRTRKGGATRTRQAAAPADRYYQATSRFTARYYRRLMKRAGGNISEAARLAGVHRSQLYRLRDRRSPMWRPTHARPEPGSYYAALETFRRKFLRRAMRLADGSVTVGAQLIGVGRTSLYRLLRRHVPSVKFAGQYGGNELWKELIRLERLKAREPARSHATG